VTIVYPLAVPLLAMVAGGISISFVFSKYSSRTNQWSPRVLIILGILGIVTAIVPNAGQQLYDLGISFPVIDSLTRVSYFLFGVAMVGVWRLLARRWQRWLFALLVPISFAQPLLWTWAYFVWTVWGFAP
jgi:hypothetical protein